MEKTTFQKLESLYTKLEKVVGKVFQGSVLISSVYTDVDYVSHFTVYNWIGTIVNVRMEERWVKTSCTSIKNNKTFIKRRKVKKNVFVLSSDSNYYETEKEVIVALSERVARYLMKNELELV